MQSWASSQIQCHSTSILCLVSVDDTTCKLLRISLCTLVSTHRWVPWAMWTDQGKNMSICNSLYPIHPSQIVWLDEPIKYYNDDMRKVLSSWNHSLAPQTESPLPDAIMVIPTTSTNHVNFSQHIHLLYPTSHKQKLPHLGWWYEILVFSLWRLVSGSDKKPSANTEFLDAKGTVVTAAVPPDQDQLERWEVKAKRACGALKTAISHDLRVLVLIRACEDDPILI